MKKIILSLILLGVVFMATPVFANNINNGLIKQVDIGSFDVWRNSAGDWIPSEPPKYTQPYRPRVEDEITGGQFSQVHMLSYIVTAPADKIDIITGVRSVTFINPTNDIQSYDGAISATSYDDYENRYKPYQTTSITNISKNYLGNGKVEVSYDIILDAAERMGKSVTKPWQGGQVQGCQFYLPILVEWETSNPPDFFPTPEGSTEWRESYKNPNTCAKTYEADPGTQLNIPVKLHNSGTQAITNFKAVWYGSGPQGWANPVWDAGEVDIPSGQFQEFSVPVTVPQQGQENRLVFKANVNGQTPLSETNQQNNIMIIRIGNPGVDLKVTIEPTKTLYHTQVISQVQPGLTIRVKRVDTGTNPVQATFTYKLPGHNPVTQTITVPPNDDYWEHHNYNVTQPGSFTTTASAYPIGLTDVNPADNTASCVQQVQLTNSQQKTDSSPKTRVGLTG